MSRSTGWLCLATVAAAAGCGGGGGGGSTDPVYLACTKAVSCGYMDSSQVPECVDGFAHLEMLIADPRRTVSCLNELTCDQFASQYYVIDTCFSYDTAAFECLSPNVLEICDEYDTCRNVDCNAACQKYYGLPGACGHTTYDQCVCDAS